MEVAGGVESPPRRLLFQSVAHSVTAITHAVTAVSNLSEADIPIYPTRPHPSPTHRAATGTEGARKVDRAPWKWAVRQRIWELLEKRDLAAPPRPVYHRMYVV